MAKMQEKLLSPEESTQKSYGFEKKVLQVFCGYLDIWFLRATFVTDFAPEKESVKDRVEAQASMIFSELGMDKWTNEYKVIRFTFGLYLRKVLSPSVYFFKKHTKALSAAMGSILFLLLLVSLWGFANLKSGDTDEQANARGAKAFSAVEHAPVTPIILALCTHAIMMIFASEQLRGLMQSDRNLAFPLTYTIFVGKGFMLFRMVLAYSSKNLGLSIDYFVWQELILTSLHAFLAPFVGDPVAPAAATGKDGSAPTPPRSKGLSYAKQLSRACLVVFCIDLMKTLAVVIYWWTHREGAIAYYFNRLPSIQVMLAASIFVHAVLDLIQFTVTAFTMLIGRIFLAFTTNQSLPECPEAKESEHEPELVFAKPLAELEDIVKNLCGFWKSQPTGWGRAALKNSHDVAIEAKFWTVSIPPHGLGGRQFLVIATVYGYGVPEVYMQVQVPQGLTSSSSFRVIELRVHHEVYGYHSIDASTLDFTKLDLLYNGHNRSKYRSAQWIDHADGPVMKFKGISSFHDKEWHRSNHRPARGSVRTKILAVLQRRSKAVPNR